MPEQGQEQNPETTSETFETWIAGQDEKVKGLYQTHITGLQNTVKATRAERDDYAKKLREAAQQLEKGSAAEKQISEMAASLEAAQRKAQFIEDAVNPEIGCRNTKAAFALANANNLFTKTGAPDWAAIKEMAPEIFGKAPTTNANAGAGTQNGSPNGGTMDDYIRRRLK
jgi:hypothetical protein